MFLEKIEIFYPIAFGIIGLYIFYNLYMFIMTIWLTYKTLPLSIIGLSFCAINVITDIYKQSDILYWTTITLLIASILNILINLYAKQHSEDNLLWNHILCSDTNGTRLGQSMTQYWYIILKKIFEKHYGLTLYKWVLSFCTILRLQITNHSKQSKRVMLSKTIPTGIAIENVKNIKRFS